MAQEFQVVLLYRQQAKLLDQVRAVVSRDETNARLKDPIPVRSTSSGFLSTLLLFLPVLLDCIPLFPLFPSSPLLFDISLVSTCLVYNCKTSWELLYFHLLSLLSRDQIPFNPHHCKARRGIMTNTELRLWYSTLVTKSFSTHQISELCALHKNSH